MYSCSDPIRTWARDSYSFCRFSLLAEEARPGSQPTASSPWEQACDFADKALGNVVLENNAAADKAPETPDESPIYKAISALHTCETKAIATLSNSEEAPGQPVSLPLALIVIPGNSEKEVEVCCVCCGATIATFRQDPGSAESDAWGMCMAAKLFLGPQKQVSLAVGYEAGHVIVWDVAQAATPSLVRTCQPLASGKLHSEPVMALDIDIGGSSGVSGSAEDKLVVFTIDYSARAVVPAMSINVRKQGVADIALRQDGKLLASAGWDGNVRVYKRANGKALAVLKYHTQAASAVVFSPETYLLASGARDGTIALWDIYCKSKKM